MDLYQYQIYKSTSNTLFSWILQTRWLNSLLNKLWRTTKFFLFLFSYDFCDGEFKSYSVNYLLVTAHTHSYIFNKSSLLVRKLCNVHNHNLSCSTNLSVIKQYFNFQFSQFWKITELHLIHQFIQFKCKYRLYRVFSSVAIHHSI